MVWLSVHNNVRFLQISIVYCLTYLETKFISSQFLFRNVHIIVYLFEFTVNKLYSKVDQSIFS